MIKTKILTNLFLRSLRALCMPFLAIRNNFFLVLNCDNLLSIKSAAAASSVLARKKERCEVIGAKWLTRVRLSDDRF